MPLPRTRRRALVASAARVTPKDSAHIARLKMAWQDRALFYHDEIGELHFASKFYERMMKPLRIYPASIDLAGKFNAIETGAPVELLARIQDPGGGRTSILGNYGRLMFITGEGFLFGRNLETDDERWMFVWRDELKFDDRGRVTQVRAPNLGPEGYEELPEGSAVAYRMWTPHPRYSGHADSPMRAVLDIAEELLVLTRTVHATATSRLVRAPFLLFPQEISPGPVQPMGDEDPLADPLGEDIAEHLEESIKDPASAAALSPYILYGSYDYIDRIRTVELHNTQTDYLERDLRMETIKRLALGLDMPPEALTGLGGTNHWAAWAIQDDAWRAHGAPIAEQFCDDLGEAYLRPALREMGYPDWNSVVVTYDEAAIVVNPDRTKDANEAWDRGAIGYKAYREALRFPEDAEQSEDEHEEWFALKTRGQVLPSEAEEGQIVEGPPPGEPGPVSEQTNLPQDASRIRGAAELAIIRCRELAGSRIRARNQSCPECLSAANNQPNAAVAALIGPENLSRLDAPPPLQLVSGGASGFTTLLSSWGYTELQARAVSELLESLAARTLFDHQLPEVPNGLIARLQRLREVA